MSEREGGREGERGGTFRLLRVCVCVRVCDSIIPT